MNQGKDFKVEYINSVYTCLQGLMPRIVDTT